MTLRDAPMAASDRARSLLAVARWREGKDQRAIGAELWLSVFDHHDVIAPCLHHGLGSMALGQQGIHGAHAPWQDELA